MEDEVTAWDDPKLYLNMESAYLVSGLSAEFQSFVSSSVNIVEYAAYEKRAELVLDRLTFGRIRKMREIPEAVKFCVAEIIELEKRAHDEGPALKSYSSDGYSETYAEPLTMEHVNDMETDIVNEHLAYVKDDNGTPLLYLGV